jgi:hypothetical protein
MGHGKKMGNDFMLLPQVPKETFSRKYYGALSGKSVKLFLQQTFIKWLHCLGLCIAGALM